MLRPLVISPIRRDAQKNRRYWKLEERLPKEERLPVEVHFGIKHYTTLIHRSGFVDMALYRDSYARRSSEWFEVAVKDYTMQKEFDVRVGIARKSGKEMVVSEAKVITYCWRDTVVFRLIRRSELRKMVHSYKELEFFVAVDQKEEEMEEINKLDRQFRTDYKELFLSGRNSDFTIHIKHMKFEVHRSILGARSPMFLAMMEHHMEEKRSGEVAIIDADLAVFKQFLLYLYTGEEEHLDWKNILELYKLGDKYCMEDLRYLCMGRMKTHLSTENFFEVFHISQQIPPHSELSEIVIQFFLEDSKEIIESEKCIQFMKEHPEETNVLMKALATNQQ